MRVDAEPPADLRLRLDECRRSSSVSRVTVDVDSSLGEPIRSELERHGVGVVTGVDVAEISGHDGTLEVRGSRRLPPPGRPGVMSYDKGAKNLVLR